MLQGLFREVRDLMHERLLTTPVEQREKIEYIKELLMREKTNNELIKKLKDELNLAMASKEKEASGKKHAEILVFELFSF